MRIKKTVSFSVVVESKSIWIVERREWETLEQARVRSLREDARELFESINRHVDNIGSIDIVENVEPVCSHCGADWTEESDTYNGGCCDDDEANNPESEAVRND